MLGASYVEFIHDNLLSYRWPGLAPPGPEGYRDKRLIESAVSRPFQSAFGEDVYPQVRQKAAALFHSLVSNHPFHDGNKRTAVMALDLFFVANANYCSLDNDEICDLAARTASYRERGVSHEDSFQQILDSLEEHVFTFAEIRKGAKVMSFAETTRIGNDHLRHESLHAVLSKVRRSLRRNKLNRLLK